MTVILIALDELYVHICMVPILLVQKKKNTIFDSLKVDFGIFW